MPQRDLLKPLQIKVKRAHALAAPKVAGKFRPSSVDRETVEIEAD